MLHVLHSHLPTAQMERYKGRDPDAGSLQLENGYYNCSAENGNVPVPVTNQ